MEWCGHPKAFVYDSSDRFYQYTSQPLKIGSDYCDIRIYRLKIYSAALTTEDIMRNFIADSRDSTTMLARYDRNSIYYNRETGTYTPYSGEGELTPEGIESEAFAEAFKTAAKLDQANGSDHTTEDVGNLMDDFNKNGKAAVLFNGVWNASGIDAGLADKIESQIFPGNVSVVTAGSGHSISANLSEAETELALEFLAYMVSPEVQAKIFTGVQANPCNTTLDLKALAEESGDPITQKLAEACTQVNSAETVVTDLNYVWGSDVGSAIINALMESAVEGTDIDARFEQLKQELTALVA